MYINLIIQTLLSFLPFLFVELIYLLKRGFYSKKFTKFKIGKVYYLNKAYYWESLDLGIAYTCINVDTMFIHFAPVNNNTCTNPLTISVNNEDCGFYTFLSLFEYVGISKNKN